MKIIVLDGHAMNPGDLDWAPLHALGDVQIHPRTPRDQIIPRLADAHAAITNKAPLDARTLAALPQLQYIGVTATGYNIIDIDAARDARVTVTNVPDYSTVAVAQAVFALLLELTNHVGQLTRDIAQRWPNADDFCYWDQPTTELAGKTFAVIGYGRIGQAVARIARAMGMNVLAVARRPIDNLEQGVQQADIDDAFARADVLSLHCPLTDETANLVSAQQIARMKPSAYLINTARGPLVDEAALADALHHNRLAGAGLDVMTSEPPAHDNPLLTAPRCVITPHIAWAATAARQRLLAATVQNLRAFIDGQPINVVN